jgi:fatty acid amide hydrolase
MNAIIYQTASEIAHKIKAGELSASEVVGAYIERIEEVNPRLNAVVFPRFEQAMQEAAAADASQKRGEALGPLHGVPITIKDPFMVKDTPATYGLPHQKNDRASADGPILITRLRQAGAIILGKTNLSQLAVYIEADNALYGRTNNPWNLERTSGGSSGGEAAIIAAGGSPLGLGADVGGSIREPAHFCGIHGLKPTAGRLTRLDLRPGFYSEGLLEGVPAQTGPMARSVDDLTLAMSILAAPGQEALDPATPPVPWRNPASVVVPGLRIAMYTDDGYFAASPAIRRAVREAAEALRALGVEVVEWTPPDVDEAMRLFFGIFTADAVAGLRRALGPDKPAAQIVPQLQGSTIPGPMRNPVAALMRSSGQERLARIVGQIGARSVDAYWKLLEDRNIYRRRFFDALTAGPFDAILCPPTSLPALLHGSTKQLTDFDSYARLFNVLGLPAGVVAASRVRAGEESDRKPSKDPIEQMAAKVEKGSVGLPVGVQVAAAWWREDIVLAVMGALEKHFKAQSDYPARPPL